jgi:hypothetical protein
MYIFDFYFQSVYFELVSVKDVRLRSLVISICWKIIDAVYWKRCHSSIEFLLHLCQNQAYLWVYFWVLHSVLFMYLIYLSIWRVLEFELRDTPLGRQASYCLSHSSSPFVLWLFQRWGHPFFLPYCPGLRSS